MQTNNALITPANFEEFAGFLMFQKNIPADRCPLNISELTEELVALYADEFLSKQTKKKQIKEMSLPRTITHAVMCSLQNCLLHRRKSPQFTFMSNSMDAKTIAMALVVLNQKYVGSHEYISASNPLISMLGLDKRPEFVWVEWQSILEWRMLPRTMRVSQKIYRHNWDELLMPDQILDCRIILDLYHPYIWQLILDDRLEDIKLFVNSTSYKLFVNQAVNFANKKRSKLNLS
jgi:hypothetical protein